MFVPATLTRYEVALVRKGNLNVVTAASVVFINLSLPSTLENSILHESGSSVVASAGGGWMS